MQDPLDPQALLAALALKVQRDQLALWDQWVLLGQLAWLALVAPMAPPVLLESPAQRAQRERSERTARLVRRGIPEPLARQALRAL
jgi:hypothetical protein